MRVGRVSQSDIDALEVDSRVLEGIEQQVAVPLAELMAAGAPKRTGAGAASIHAEPLPDGTPGFGVGWTPDHFYLGFHELGTEHQPAQPFAAPAADTFNA